MIAELSHDRLKAVGFRVPISERVRVCVHNLGCLHIRLAWWILSRAMKRDKDFRDSWQSNIAMPIHDHTRPTCTCQFDSGHESTCALVRANKERNFHAVDISTCNAIADRLMKHLFDA
jgi:hypothetical protein